MPLDPRRACAELEEELRAVGTAERAAGEKRYLESDLVHLGATVWQNRRAVRSFFRCWRSSSAIRTPGRWSMHWLTG